MFEPREALFNDFTQGHLFVEGQRTHIRHHFGLGETGCLDIDFGLGNAGVDETLGVFAILDGKGPVKSQFFSMTTQHTMADGVKGAAPQITHVVPYQIGHPAHHFLGSLIGKGE